MHRGRHNVVRTSVSHSTSSRGPLFCSYRVVTSSACASITEQKTAKWNLFVKIFRAWCRLLIMTATIIALPCTHIPHNPAKCRSFTCYIHSWTTTLQSKPFASTFEMAQWTLRTKYSVKYSVRFISFTFSVHLLWVYSTCALVTACILWRSCSFSCWNIIVKFPSFLCLLFLF